MKSTAPGAWFLEGFLTLDEQVTLANRCQHLIDDDRVGGYTPTVRGGAKMRVRMLALGRHWNPLTYKYEETRADFDGRPVLPLPDDLAGVARRAAAAAGLDFHPDICLINWYGDQGRLGVHQDKDESRESLEAGWPVVSLSVGNTARFLFGGLRRRDPMETPHLPSRVAADSA
jgi:alkylated DNA repair dioxygenase AlkB